MYLEFLNWFKRFKLSIDLYQHDIEIYFKVYLFKWLEQSNLFHCFVKQIEIAVKVKFSKAMALLYHDKYFFSINIF